MKHLLAITITLLPSAALAQQFTPQQMLDVMTKSPGNRDVRVHDDFIQRTRSPHELISVPMDKVDAPYLKYFLLNNLRVRKYQFTLTNR